MGVRYNSSVVTNGLVGYWDSRNSRSNLNTGTTILDVSGLRNNGTTTNLTYSNNEFIFNGTNAFVDFGTNSSLDLTSAATFEAVIYPTSINSNGEIGLFARGDAGTTNIDWLIALGLYQAGNAFFPAFSGPITGGNVVSSQRIVLNTYNFLTITFSYPGNARIYLNGKLVGTKTTTGNLPATAGRTVKFGRGIGSAQIYYAGRLTVARIYNRELSESEVLQNYNATKRSFVISEVPNFSSTIVNYSRNSLVYNFDAVDPTSNPTGSGNVWFNSANTNANASFISTAEFRGNYVYFNGANNAYAVSNASMNVDYSAGITVEGIVNFEQAGSTSFWPRIIDFGVGQANENILFAKRDTSSDLRFEILQGGSSTGLTAPSSVVFNQTKQYVAVANGTHFVIYVDGNVVASTATSTLPLRRARASNRIGRSNWPDGAFYGYMHAVRIYNRALSNTEIQQNYLYAKKTYGLL